MTRKGKVKRGKKVKKAPGTFYSSAFQKNNEVWGSNSVVWTSLDSLMHIIEILNEKVIQLDKIH